MNVFHDISDIIDDTDWNQPFQVLRNEVKVNNKGRLEKTQETITLKGVIYPSTSEEIERFFDSENVKDFITVYTREDLFTADSARKADIIIWQGREFLIKSIEIWADYGYLKAIAELKGNSGVNVVRYLKEDIKEDVNESAENGENSDDNNVDNMRESNEEEHL